ncbi:MAG TPA: hypothetical protein VM940_00320 [Chthoniobacterales bacterium]|nr:hypothetical protein [Chthoniobacterales bacterium]
MIKRSTTGTASQSCSQSLKILPFRMNLPDPEPMMSLDKFTEQMGVSSATIWRWRNMKMLSTINICGRRYILRSEVARFNARAAAGEFAKAPTMPKRFNRVIETA